MNYSLNIAELKAALNSLPENGASKEINESDAMINAIDDLVKEENLKGPGWTSVKVSLKQYQAALQTRKEVAYSLYSDIKNALNTLIIFMGDYEKIDTSQKEEIELTIKKCKLSIENCQKCIYKVKVVTKDGNTKWVYTYSESKRKSLAESIEKYEFIINKLDGLLNKIKELPDEYKKAQGILNNAFGEVDGFESKVSELKPHSLDLIEV